MSLNSIYKAVKSQPVKMRTIQQVLQENPEKKSLFIDSEVVPGKNFSFSNSDKTNSTSIMGIAKQIESSHVGAGSPGLPVMQRSWENCKAKKEKSGIFFCQKFQMKCVKEKCPSKFMDF